ncbi:hypothetical protein ACMFMG_010150 [Clarireedia jacksonii]
MGSQASNATGGLVQDLNLETLTAGAILQVQVNDGIFRIDHTITSIGVSNVNPTSGDSKASTTAEEKRSQGEDGLPDLQVRHTIPLVVVDKEANSKLEYDASSAMKADPPVRSVFRQVDNAMVIP